MYIPLAVSFSTEGLLTLRDEAAGLSVIETWDAMGVEAGNLIFPRDWQSSAALGGLDVRKPPLMFQSFGQSTSRPPFPDQIYHVG